VRPILGVIVTRESFRGDLFFLSVTDVLPISEVQTPVDIEVVAETDPYLPQCLPQLHKLDSDSLDAIVM
jgi:hypothetical protein